MKLFLKIFLITGCLFLVLTIGGAFAFWIAPGPFIRTALGSVKKATNADVNLGDIRGNPLSGWTVENISYESSPLSFTIKALSFRINWGGLVSKSFVFDTILIHQPHVALDLEVFGNDKKEDKIKSGRKSSWALLADRIEISDGSLVLQDSSKWTPNRLTQLNAKLELRQNQLRVHSFRVNDEEKTVAAEGEVAFDPLEARLSVQSSGSFQLPIKLRGQPLAVADPTINAVYQENTLTIKSAQAEVLKSAVSAYGSVAFTPFKADLTLNALGPLNANAEVRGSTGHLNGLIDASYRDANIQGRIYLREGEAWRAYLKFNDIEAFNLGPTKGTLDGSGRGYSPTNLAGRIRLETQSSKGLHVVGLARADQGEIHASIFPNGPGINGSIKGAWFPSTERIAGNVELKIKKEFFSRHTASSTADMDLKASVSGKWPDPHMNFMGSIQDISFGTTTINKAQLRISGTPKDHNFKIVLIKNDQMIHADGEGEFIENVWTANWPYLQLHLANPPAAPQIWTSTQTFQTTIGNGFVQISGLQLTANNARLTLNAALNGKRIRSLEADVKNFDLGLLSNAGVINIPVSGEMNGHVSLKGKLRKPAGNFSFTVENIQYKNAPIGNVISRGQISEERVQITQFDLQTSTGFIQVKGNIPLQFQKGRIPPFDLAVRASQFDPSVITQHMAQFNLGNSRMEADLRLSGRAQNFSAEGTFNLTANEMRVPSQGITLKNLVLQFQADGQTLRILQAQADSVKDGSLKMTGFLSQSEVSVKIDAKKFSFNSSMGLSGTVNADLIFSGIWNSPSLSGSLDVLEANFRPEEQKEKPKPSKEEPPRQPLPLAMDVKIEFDRNVWYKKGQTSIETRGNLTIRKEPALSPLIFGTIQTIRGTYIFYGRAFEIEQGRITFLGQPSPDPSLDIRTLYVSEATKFKVYLTVTGSARQPVVKLTSEPPLPESDIISVLVTGAPLSSPQDGPQRESEAVARTLAANYLAEKVRERLQNRLELDVFRFKVTDEGETAVTLGRNVTQDLFVSYNETLGPEGQRRIRAEYELTKHWGLEGYTTSIGRYVIDLLFRFGFY